MNTDVLEGKWKQLKGKVKRQWSELTDDDLDRIDGKTDELLGTLQEKYGKTREEAKKEFDDFRAKLDS